MSDTELTWFNTLDGVGANIVWVDGTELKYRVCRDGDSYMAISHTGQLMGIYQSLSKAKERCQAIHEKFIGEYHSDE